MTGVIQGVLSDGDIVEIASHWQPGQTLEPKSFLNRTTGGTVQIKSLGGCAKAAVIILVIVFILFFLGVAGGFLHTLFNHV